MSGMVFCTGCGGDLHSTAPACPKCGAPKARAFLGAERGRSFAEAIRICFSKYASFSGRAPRSELWFWFLFTMLAGFVVGFVGGIFNVMLGSHAPSQIATGLVALLFFLPDIAVIVRRLHDLDKSGWWYWLFLIPIVGWIIMLVWQCTRGTSGSNRFGPDPLNEAF